MTDFKMRRVGQKPKFSVEQIRQMALEYQSGATIRDIAQRYDSTPSTIHKWLKRLEQGELGE